MDTYFFIRLTLIASSGVVEAKIGPYLNLAEATLLATDHLERLIRTVSIKGHITRITITEEITGPGGFEVISVRLTEEKK